MHKLLTGTLVGVLILLAGCASTVTSISQSTPQNSKQARIYILRDTQFIGELASPDIKVDDQNVGSSRPGRYFFVDRDPGPRVVSVNSMPGYYAVTVMARPGSIHYVQVGPRPVAERMLMGGLIPQAIEQASTGHNGPYIIEEMSEAAGRQLLQKLQSASS